MKVLEKVAQILFSYIALILSIILCLAIFGWIDIELMHNILKYSIADASISKVIVIVSIVIVLLAIKCIFFDATSKDLTQKNEGILLENSDGKLLISKGTLESLIASVAKGFNGAESVKSKVYVDKENNLCVYLTLFVHPDAVIKDLSINLQNKIKEVIKKTSDLDVKEVNIKIQDIVIEEQIGE